MPNSSRFQLVSPAKIISPKRGSLFFELKHPLLPSQPLGWAMVELTWSEPTLIEPFLEDVKNFINQSIKSLDNINNQAISALYFKIKNRFVDWGLGLVFIFRRQEASLNFYFCGQIKAYTINQSRLLSIPTNKEVTSFIFLAKPKTKILFTSEIMPQNLIIDQPLVFLKTLKNQKIGHLFVSVNPTKKGFQLPKPRLSKHFLRLFVMGVIVFLAVEFSIFSSRNYKSSKGKLITSPTVDNSQLTTVNNLLDQAEQQVKANPISSGRLLARAKAIARASNLNQDKIWQRIKKLTSQLGQSYAGDGQPIIVENKVFFPIGSGRIGGDLFYFNHKAIVLVKIVGNKIKPSKLIKVKQEPILDAVSSGVNLYFLTSKGIFLLKPGQQGKQIANLPSGAKASKIAVYNQNLYLLSRDGSLYKYPAGLVKYPVKPELYFFAPELQEIKRLVVNKRFYFLNTSGNLLVFYFGQPQNFSFSQPIKPLTDIDYNPNKKVFYFLGHNSWGSFNSIGQVLSLNKLKFTFNSLISLNDKIVFSSDNQLFVRSIKNEKNNHH